MSGDKDDPRFDEFYRDGNELRVFLSLLLPTLPSYTALGFELRDRHDEPAPNEYYTKLYVFHEEHGPKATRGPYRFGSNTRLFERIERIRRFAGEFLATLPASAPSGAPQAGAGSELRWLLPPDATGGTPTFAWMLSSAERYAFVATTPAAGESTDVLVPVPGAADGEAALLFSTETGATDGTVSNARLLAGDMIPGEARVYRLGPDPDVDR
jgi:hypothetical protein